MSDFLDSLTFLSDEQRQLLRDKDLDSPECFKHITVTRLEAAPFNLSPGRASRLLTAAGVGHGPASTTITIAEPPDEDTRIERALLAARDDPSKAPALAAIGVELVVLDDASKVDVAQTKRMRAHAATGAAVGATWQGRKIVRARTLGMPVVLCSPRTGKALQDGRDEVTGTPWGELGLDTLRLVAFGYREGIIAAMGLGEPEAFAQIRDDKSGLRQRLSARMKALEVKPEEMDDIVVFKVGLSPGTRHDAPTSARPVPSGARPKNLADLFLVLFEVGELQRFIRYLPDGDRLATELPGGSVSAAQFAWEAADLLHRHGRVNRALQMALRAERPRRADAIDAVFNT